jgi:serine/threonine protein kinase
MEQAMTTAAAAACEATIRTLAEGDELAPGYRVLAHLRRGDTMDVYDVWSEVRACRCVAKMLRPDRLADRDDRRGLLREGRLLKRLTHLHIVRAYEVVEEPLPGVILETLTGATLSYLIEESYRRMDLADVALLGIQLCSALHYLHGQGYLHLDLKPSNIVVCQGLARVIDLSIARRPGHGPKGVGTRVYMAPEQARGGTLGPAADVWGIGATLYEAATGEPPFAYLEGRRYDQLERRAIPIRAHRRVPAAFAAVVDACFDPDPAGRPTVLDLTHALEAFA